MGPTDVFYTPKYHPDTAKILHQAISSLTSLAIITLLTVGALWFTSTARSTPAILGTQTQSP